MQKRRVSIILFFDKNGRILVQDRKGYKKGADYGFFGGKIEEGETSEQALIREIKEELGFTIKDFSLFKHYIKQDPEKDWEIEYYVYYAPMPEIESLIVSEGKIHLTNFKDFKKLDLSENDIGLIKGICSYLKKKKAIIE